MLPPARQGDVWRALTLRPKAIALIDGVFESSPSVWHHELLAALDAGVAVFGAASMGALRAAELEAHGMVGVGQIFRWYRDGTLEDDAEVALLHAGAEHGHRPLTLPLVNVRHGATLAQGAGVLSAREAKTLVEVASSIHYQERTWPRVIATTGWGSACRKRWEAFAKQGLEDLKAKDARECLQLAAQFVASGSPGPRPRKSSPPAHARRRRLYEGASYAPNGRSAISSGKVMEAISRRSDAKGLAAAGLSRALLAGWARSLGIEPSAARLARAEKKWLDGLGVSPRERGAFLSASGLDEGEAAALVETLALEELALELSEQLLSDGPSAEEGLAAEARIRGLWASRVRRGY